MLEHFWFCFDCTAKQCKIFLLNIVQVEVLLYIDPSPYLDGFLNCLLKRKGTQSSLIGTCLYLMQIEVKEKPLNNNGCDFLEMSLYIRDD